MQVQAVRNGNRKYGTGTKGWWNTVNKITGSESKALNISSVIKPVDIYCFFKIITSTEREVKVSQRSGMYQSYNFLTRLGMQSL